MQRAIRRHYKALIKQRIQKKIDFNTQAYDTDPFWIRYNASRPEKAKTEREQMIRRMLRNEGKRRKGERNGCGCFYCTGDLTRAYQANKILKDGELEDFFPHGCYIPFEDDSSYSQNIV